MELLLPVLVLLLFYVLLIMPAQRRQRRQAQMQSSLEPGTQVILAGGIHAVLRDVGDPDKVTAEIAPGVRIDVARGGVVAVIPPADEPGDDVIAGEALETPADREPTLDELDDRPGTERRDG